MDKMQVYVFRGPSRITPSSNVHVHQVESVDGEVASVALLEHPGEVGRVDDNPVAERIYVEAGFDKIEHTITG